MTVTSTGAMTRKARSPPRLSRTIARKTHIEMMINRLYIAIAYNDREIAALRTLPAPCSTRLRAMTTSRRRAGRRKRSTTTATTTDCTDCI